MFVNREKHLKTLNDEFNRSGFTFTILYGRRRVGKTRLIKEYIKDKKAFYFLSSLENINITINRMKNELANFYNDDLLKQIQINDIKTLFLYIANKINEKIVIVIDEFQYLAKIDNSIPSQFQYICDEIFKNKNIHLILCGSIISMMYEYTLSYNSPLYGRRTSAIKLEAIEFKYLKDFFPNKTKNELIEIYSVFYSIPKYLELINDKGDIYENIKANILNPNSYLYNEASFVLQNEINEPITYFSILKIIASGEHKIGNIASKLGKSPNNITSFIDKLIELDIIYKINPITEKNPEKSKKSLYFIKDNFLRFYFAYVLPHKSQLELDNTDYVINIIKTNFAEFVSKVYEDLAINYLLNTYKELLKCGRWWDKDTEIDAIGVAKDYLIVAECKYKNKAVGINVLEDLKTKAKKIDSNLPIKKYILFSKSGFTNDLKALASNEIILIDLL